MAISINKVFICGHAGADPDMRSLSNGNPVANLRIATNEGYKDRNGNWVEKTEWHRIVVFGRSAEWVRDNVRKGDNVHVEGALQTREWEDQQGNKKTSTEVKAFRIQKPGAKAGGSGRPADNQGGAGGGFYGNQGDGGGFDDDDIPF